jgi:hypothetical protein
MHIRKRSRLSRRILVGSGYGCNGTVGLTAKKLCAELSLSRDTIYKLESAGRLKAIHGIRHKIFSQTAVERFLRGDRADWQRR